MILIMSHKYMHLYLYFDLFLWALRALGRGDVNQFKFTLILSLSCQQLQRSLYFVGFTYIYCMYLANNWRDICILLGFFGPFGPRVWGDVNQFKFTLIVCISCQQLERDLYFVGFTYILYISCRQLERYL